MSHSGPKGLLFSLVSEVCHPHKPASILSLLVTVSFYQNFQNLIDVFYFSENNKRTMRIVDRFLQDGASADIQSLRISTVIKLCQTSGNGLYKEYTVNSISSSTNLYIFGVKLLLYTENILSTLAKSLIRYYSVHGSIRSTLSSLYLFTKSIHIPE